MLCTTLQSEPRCGSGELKEAGEDFEPVAANRIVSLAPSHELEERVKSIKPYLQCLVVAGYHIQNEWLYAMSVEFDPDSIRRIDNPITRELFGAIGATDLKEYYLPAFAKIKPSPAS